MVSPRMEQVFFHTHSKISHSILRHSSRRFRSTVEHLILGLAVCGFCVVLLSHVTFVHRGDFLRGADDCMRSGEGVCEGRGGVSVYSILIRLAMSGYTWFMSSGFVVDLGIVKSLTKKQQIPLSCLRSIPGFSEDADVTHILLCMDDGPRDTNATKSWAFTVSSGRHQYNELIVTGLLVNNADEQQVRVDTDRQLSSCVITPDASAIDQRTKRRERWVGKVNNCPASITALLSRHDYFPPNQNNTNIEISTNPSSIIYSYSHAEGLLMLSPALKQKHNITTQFVLASSSDTNCFGEPFVQNIVFSIVGSDTVILNWILGLQQHLTTKNEGINNIRFVHHWKTGKDLDLDLFDMDHYAFSSSGSRSKYGFDLTSYPVLQNMMAYVYKHPVSRLVRFLMFKMAVFLSTLFIFFLTTSLVSFTFQETQDRMLEFTLQLQTYVRARLPLGGLIVRHILENVVFVPVMVGMIFFLIEFYEGDKFLAFMVLSMVWIAEVFSAISIRSIQSMHFFPRVFFLYFTLFHVYFFSCPIGFTYASLASTSLFLIHTMLFFLNRYELPAINARLVTPEIPRMRDMDVGQRPPTPPPIQSLWNQLPQVPDLSSRDNNRTTANTYPTDQLSSSTARPPAQHASLPQNSMRNYVLAASTSIQSIRSLASMQSLAGRASPNWLYASGGADAEEDEDSFMAYVGDGARSSFYMSAENR